MTRRSWRTRTMFAAVVAATVAWPAAPAHATPPQVSVQVPPKVTANPVDIQVTASMNDQPAAVPDGEIRSITIRVAGSNAPAPFTRDYGDDGGRVETVVWKPSIAYNGKYVVTAQAIGREFQGRDESSATPAPGQASYREVLVEIPAAPPTGLKVVGDGEKRLAAISWNRNTEPDVVGYIIERAFGDGSYAELARTDNDCGGDPPRCSYTDDLKGAAGGEYKYQVRAVRPDAEGDAGIQSAASERGAVRMRANATTTTTVPGGGGGGGSGGSGGGGSGSGSGITGGGVSKSGTAKSGKVDLSGFAASLPRSQRIQRGGGEVDGGFHPTLPFDPSRPAEEQGGEQVDPGEQAIIRERPAASESDSHAPLLFVAAGLLATVLLMHVLWLKSEVEKVPLEAVVPTAD